MKPLLCIYHFPCADGFTSAWIVNKFCQQNSIAVDFHPTDYKSLPPDVTDRHVLMVDFSYKMDVLAEMHHAARSLLVLDHHKTAMEDLSALLPAPRLPEMVERWLDPGSYYSAHALFDMNRSGAGITWDYFFPTIPRPALVNHVEDRDLWVFKIPGTREIQACVFSYAYDFEMWDRLADKCESPDGRIDMVMQGTAIERKHHKDIRELVEMCTRPMRFNTPDGPVIVPVANLSYLMTSDAGQLLCSRNVYGQPMPKDTSNSDINPMKYRQPFAVCYYDKPDGREFSFRSPADGADVGAIARLYGGGGHAHSAGCFVKHSDLAQFEL